jgi:hypothetical protein
MENALLMDTPIWLWEKDVTASSRSEGTEEGPNKRRFTLDVVEGNLPADSFQGYTGKPPESYLDKEPENSYNLRCFSDF